MALSTDTKFRLEHALTDKAAATEMAAAVDSQAAVVAALGATANLTGVDGVGSNAADLVTTEARLDAIEAKVDEIIAALQAASLMAS